MASGRERQLIAAAVALQAATGNQPAPLKIVEGWSERGLVAAVGAAEPGLADAGIAADQHQQRKSTRTEIHLLRLVGKCLEGGDLRQTQMEAEPVGERAVVDACHQLQLFSSAASRL